MKYYLAIDIGASSGRHIIGYYENNELVTKEIFRFPNSVKEQNGHLIWDMESIFNNVKEGIKLVLKEYPNVESMSIDTWGVDYVLLDQNNQEILPVYAYRDTRTKKVIDEVHSKISFDELYKITGSQFQEFNTIYQMYEDKINNRLDKASYYLHIPEYLMYKLTGVKVHEYTNASTTGMMDGNTNDFSKEIIEKLGFKKELFTKLEKPGFVVGDFKEEIRNEVGGNIKVKLCPTHDTASAVEAIKMDKNGPYISSGTWSLLGIKNDKVINSVESMNANYSNEYGPNYIRYQKNIMGLWIAQNLSKQFNKDHVELAKIAQESTYNELFDVNDICFLSTLDMKNEIKNWFIRHNIKDPVEEKDYINATYRSLAQSYKIALDELESIVNKKFDSIYIVGGGAKNKYLNKLTEEFTNKKVVALPIEATAIGNLLSQMED